MQVLDEGSSDASAANRPACAVQVARARPVGRVRALVADLDARDHDRAADREQRVGALVFPDAAQRERPVWDAVEFAV